MWLTLCLSILSKYHLQCIVELKKALHLFCPHCYPTIHQICDILLYKVYREKQTIKNLIYWDWKTENRCIVGYILSFLQSHNASYLWYFAIWDKPYVISPMQKVLWSQPNSTSHPKVCWTSNKACKFPQIMWSWYSRCKRDISIKAGEHPHKSWTWGYDVTYDLPIITLVCSICFVFAYL